MEDDEFMTKAERREHKQKNSKKMTVHGKSLGEFYENSIKKEIKKLEKQRRIQRDEYQDMDI